jgi:hypothetical protein
MIRPAERFTVNVRPAEPMAQISRPSGWAWSMPSTLLAAALVGAAIGGVVPSGRPFSHSPETAVQTAQVAPDNVAQIEPAAGPAAASGAQLIARAPDGAFYTTAALDRVPVTMRLEPDRQVSLLVPRDVARLVPGGVITPTVRVSELALHGRVAGPVEVAVSDVDAPVSLLGADLLHDFDVVVVDRDHLRLVAR